MIRISNEMKTYKFAETVQQTNNDLMKYRRADLLTQ